MLSSNKNISMTNGRKQLVDFTVLLLRIVAGILFIQHGGVKLFGWFGGMPPDGAKAVPMTMPFIAGLLEVVGGALIMLGLFTRVVGFILSGEMAVAYFMVHAPQGTWPMENHGEAAVLFCFIFLVLAAYGAGKFSVDHAINKRKNA